MRVETSVHEDRTGVENFIFCISPSTIREHLLSRYNDKNSYIKSKDTVTDSTKLNPSKVIYAVIYESKNYFVLHTSLYACMYYETLNIRDMILTSTIAIVHV